MNSLSSSAVIKEKVYIGENVIIEDNVYIDYGAIIRDNVIIKKGSFIGANCIIGEYLGDFFANKTNSSHPCIIGENSVIRSGSIIYGDNIIGDNLQTGHRVTVREGNIIGKNVRIGTNTDIQFECNIGNYVSFHSGVFVAEKTVIEDFVWIFPCVVITNDPTPPSYKIKPVTIKKFASVSAKSVILPGVVIGEGALIGAGSVVTKDVYADAAVIGNPAKFVRKASEIIDKETGEPAYPWMKNFQRGMPWNEMGFDEWVSMEK